MDNEIPNYKDDEGEEEEEEGDGEETEYNDAGDIMTLLLILDEHSDK